MDNIFSTSEGNFLKKIKIVFVIYCFFFSSDF